MLLCYEQLFRILDGSHYYSTMTINIYDASAQELRNTPGEKKAAKIVKLRDTKVFTEEKLAAEIQIPLKAI